MIQTISDTIEEVRDEIATMHLNKKGPKDLKFLYKMVSELDLPGYFLL